MQGRIGTEDAVLLALSLGTLKWHLWSEVADSFPSSWMRGKQEPVEGSREVGSHGRQGKGRGRCHRAARGIW